MNAAAGAVPPPFLYYSKTGALPGPANLGPSLAETSTLRLDGRARAAFPWGKDMLYKRLRSTTGLHNIIFLKVYF